MYKKYKRKSKLKLNLTYIGILLIILFSTIGLGYAYFSETLKIQGTLSIKHSDGDGDPGGGNDGPVPAITVTFTAANVTQNTLHYTIRVTNISEVMITTWRFKLGMPTDTKYSVWNAAGATIQQNHITGYNLAPGASVQLTGAITLPSGFTASNYTNPTITGILLNFNLSDYPIGYEELPSIQEITLGVTDVTIGLDESFQISAERFPSNAAGAITWTSSNSNVVKVNSNGIITGVSAGSAIITAKAGSAIATCTVTVTDYVVPLTITFTPTSVWTESMNFTITVKNITNTPISGWSFRIVVPTGTTCQVWQGASFSNGVFTGTSFAKISANGTITFSGQMKLPAGVNETFYTNPTIVDIQVQQ